MPDRSRYRNINWIGARILQARELNKLQTLERQVDDNNVPSAYNLTALYRQGATLNVTATISPGTKTVTLTPTVAGQMLVFIRNQWEILKVAEAPAITLLASGPTQNNLFLNYQVVRITSAEDIQLVDLSSGESVAEMGELLMQVSATDDSARSLSANEFEKNIIPISLFNFTHSGATVVPVPQDNVNPQSLAKKDQAGLSKLSTATASGIAVGNDDPRLSDARGVLAGSVVNASVRTPVPSGGNNADGTPVYGLTSDPGGISAAKIVYTAGTQLFSDAYNWLKTQFLSLQTRFNDHETAPLGQVNTHPLPPFSGVPLSHVGQPLGLTTSHQALVTSDVGGYRKMAATAATPSPTDYAYVTQNSSGTTLSGLVANGDIFSTLANLAVAAPLNEGGETLTTGPLGLVSILSKVLAEHVNKTSHKNPHGLTASDIAAATITQVNTGDTNTLNNAKAYTDAKVPHVSLAYIGVTSGAYLSITFAPNGGAPITLAYGSGTVSLAAGGSFTIPVPAGHAPSNSIPQWSVVSIPFAAGDIASINANVSGLSISGIAVQRFNGSGSSTGVTGGFWTWTNLTWK